MSERRVSFLGAMLVAVGPVSMALFTPAMPEIVRAFGTSEAAVKMTLSLYFAGFALAQLICGPLSDALGRKPVVLAFMGLYLAASVAALVAPTIELLIAARFVQGIGAASGIAVARAVVRDLYTGERSVRIMNMIGIILGIGPAVSPTLGGLTMQWAGWQAIFLLMTVFGLAILITVRFAMAETVQPDPARLQPRALVVSYGRLARHPYFMSSSLVIAGAVGTLYAQATILPFVLMDRVGLTPAEFGLGMLMQSGMFFVGSVVVRGLLASRHAGRLVAFGLAAMAAGSLGLIGLSAGIPVSFLTVMGPVAAYAFGIAFVMPAMMTAALAPFPSNAGTAAALTGFLQMGAGLAGGLAAAAIGDPVRALSVVIPAMGAAAILSWLWWRSQPEPQPLSDVPYRPDPASGQEAVLHRLPSGS
jgi:DHA1 family bicyclomycin/chloramphenicol resistance-like MFS transporter